MPKTGTALSLLICCLAPCTAALAAPYTFTPTFSGVAGINDNGQIVGDAGGIGFVQNLATGVVTTLPPRGFSTLAEGINNNGLVTGYFTTSGDTSGFVIDPATGVSTTLPHEGSFPSGFFPKGINDAGQVVGYVPSGYHSNLADVSFLYDPSTNTSSTFVDPATGTASGYMTTTQIGYTHATDIDNRGQIVGNTLTPTPTSGGVFQPTGFLLDLATNVDAVISVPGASATTADGLNDRGQIVGSYTSGGTTNGYIFDIATGQYTTLDDPAADAVSTVLLGIDNAGQIVGNYRDASGAAFGFIATPSPATAVPEPPPLPLLGLALAAFALTRRTHYPARQTAILDRISVDRRIQSKA